MNKKYIFAYKVRETLFSFLSISMLITALACSHSKEKPEAGQHPLPVVHPELSTEVSLKEDRAQLAEMRKEVPEEKKQENDELALILQTMKSDTYLGQDKDPHKVREDFDHILRKRRSKFDQEVQKLRDDYNKAERKNREEFTKAQQDERAEFLKKKVKTEERKEFYEDQDGKRKEYFANEKEKRAEFESSMTEKRRNYEDHVREVTNKFNQEHKAYTKYYHERKKAEGVMQRVQDRARAKGHLPSQQPTSAGGGRASNGDAAQDTVNPSLQPSPQTPTTPLRSGDADSN